LDVSAEVLPPHDLLDRFQRITFGADRLKPALNIEKARLSHDSLVPSAHGPLQSASQIRSDLARRIFRGALGDIPWKYTCEGEMVQGNLVRVVSPPLDWEGVPNGTKSLVLIMDDPDAPDPNAPQMVWVHWVVYNIPPDTKSLPENAARAGLPQ